LTGLVTFSPYTCKKREDNVLLIQHIEHLREAFRETRQDHPLEIDAIVIVPEHLYCIWQLPPDDSDYSTRWRLIKARFSMAIPKTERISKSRIRKSELGIWHATVLGACNSRSAGLSKSCGLYPLQSRQAWSCESRQGLALFIISPLANPSLLPC
jgi:REP element-mobilizing transposase RayT